jgi:N-acetylglutamate synthase-like GNAT family acetyltransferase
MYRCCYVLSDANKRYSRQLEDCDCVEGDRTDLITQIKHNENFCRDQQAIGYEYFVDSLEEYSIIYIQNEIDNNILGACSIDLDTDINMFSICVPDHGIKGIGKLLLDTVKVIGKLIDAECIFLLAKSSVRGFYKKNGFKDYDYEDQPIYGRTYSMIYNLEENLKTPTKGGKRKTTSQKSNRKNKQRKITKKRNMNFLKRRKHNKNE